MSRLTNVVRASALPARIAAGLLLIAPAGAAAQESAAPAQCLDQAGSPGSAVADQNAAAGGARVDHAINTKGTGMAGRAGTGDQDCDGLDNDCDSRASGPIKVSASQSGQTLKHAINTKGTGVAGIADEEAKGASGPKALIKVSASQNGQTLRHAINTKGTGATGKTDAAPEGAGKYSSPINISRGDRVAACPSASAGDQASKDRVAVKSGHVIPKP
jgi:hypothetical protein